ncbi:chymotrypsin inhibitor-like [Osmia bicornis bicornis]|uniref:chymotrypsin inhibitor-like n=1 Tax=Osmia bicornis bicornis TaxID=1437191 RepID=UPI0010F97D07|nr:chymotrypsin inhibitor-like [Osmia bicornis bicornis]
MSPRFSVLLLFVAIACISLSYAGISGPVPLCPSDEIFKTCGTSCPLKCGVPPAKQCIAKCVVGCFCKDGYFRNAANQCVLRENC